MIKMNKDTLERAAYSFNLCELLFDRSCESSLNLNHSSVEKKKTFCVPRSRAGYLQRNNSSYFNAFKTIPLQ